MFKKLVNENKNPEIKNFIEKVKKENLELVKKG